MTLYALFWDDSGENFIGVYSTQEKAVAAAVETIANTDDEKREYVLGEDYSVVPHDKVFGVNYVTFKDKETSLNIPSFYILQTATDKAYVRQTR